MAAAASRRKTKIVATLGAASRDEGVLRQLLDAGMDVARINLGHGSTAEHAASIAAVRRAAAGGDAPLAVIIDLPGPKFRLGDLPRRLEVRAGDSVTFGPTGAAQLPVSFPELLRAADRRRACPHRRRRRRSARTRGDSPSAGHARGLERRHDRVAQGA